MSTLQVTSIESKTANTPPIIKDSNGVEVGTLCRAWVHFSMTGGIITVYESFNVASVTYIATGKFAVNFITPMPHSTYVVVAEANAIASFLNRSFNIARGLMSTTSTGEIAYLENNNLANSGTVCVAIFA